MTLNKDLWEYIEHLHTRMKDEYGVKAARNLIPKALEKAFLEKYLDSIMNVDGCGIPIHVNNNIPENNRDGVTDTEVWIIEVDTLKA